MPSSRTNSLHLVEATTMRPVVDHLFRHTSKAARSISESGLSPDMFESNGSYIPLHLMMGLLNRAERQSGDQLFAWNCIVNASKSSAAGLFQDYFGREPTVYESLVKFAEVLNLKSSGGKYWCVAKKNEISLVRTTERNSPVDNWASEQFVLASYIRILSGVLGSHVVPTTVTLREPVVPACLPEILQGCQIIPGQKNTSISVSVAKPYTHKNLAVGVPFLKDDPENDKSKVKIQLLNMMLPKNGDGAPSLISMSEAFGLSIRTLQRRLFEHGLSYSEICDEIRFRRCLEALSDPSLSISSIAFEVDFKNPGDFSRAFSRRMGISPKEYRRQQLGDP